MIKEYLFGENKILLNTRNGKLLYQNNTESIIDDDFYSDDEFDIMNQNYNYDTINISINITKQCNLNCKYCFNKNKENKRVSVQDSIRFIEKIIKDFPNAKKYHVDLSGSGEPLLELDTILKIATYCKDKSNEIRKEILPMFVCNGTLLTKEIAEILQNHGVLFGISLDGTKKYHDKNRIFKNGKPTFDIILKNVKNIKNRDYVGCAITINDDDINLVKMVKLLRKYFNTISIKFARSNDKLDINLIKNQYTQLANFLVNEIYNKKIDVLMCLLNGDDLFGKYISLVLQNSISNHRCDAGIGKFALNSDLLVYTCSGAVYSDDLCLGSIDNIDYLKGRKIIQNALNNQKCQNCIIQKYCGHECLVRLSDGMDDFMCQIKEHLLTLALMLSIIIRNNDNLYLYLVSFLEDKAKRFSGDIEFDDYVKFYDDYSFTDLKMIKDFDEKKYKSMLDEINT